MGTRKLDELLKSYVKLSLDEARVREADLSGDKKSEWGSFDHIADLEKRIDDLTYWRDKQKRGSDARANYSRIISRLKGDLSSAKKKVKRPKPLKEGKYKDLMNSTAYKVYGGVHETMDVVDPALVKKAFVLADELDNDISHMQKLNPDDEWAVHNKVYNKFESLKNLYEEIFGIELKDDPTR